MEVLVDPMLGSTMPNQPPEATSWHDHKYLAIRHATLALSAEDCTIQ
jgi:hypothetical protein